MGGGGAGGYQALMFISHWISKKKDSQFERKVDENFTPLSNKGSPWPIIRKGAQYHWSAGTCMLKSQRDATAHHQEHPTEKDEEPGC